MADIIRAFFDGPGDAPRTPADLSEKPSGESVWTPAVFLDRAEELRRRLLLWHAEDWGMVWIPTRIEAEAAMSWTFRRVLQGDHRPRPPRGYRFVNGIAFPSAAAAGSTGMAFPVIPPDHDRDLTLWMLRDFWEHLPDAGESQLAAYLRLKFDRILAMPMYRQREPESPREQAWLDEQWRYVLDINPDRCSEGAPAGFVFGREIDRGRLGELVAAAERLLRGTGQSQKGLSGAAIDASFNPDDSDMPSPGDRHTLTVDVERGVAVLDGTAFPINSPQALRWLKVLLDRDGRPVSSSELEDFDPELLGARTDRLKKLLPPQIRALIHSKTGTGSRLVIRRDVT